METLTLELPAMYGDHHVVEVRQVLLSLPGVKAVYASSCFQVVEVQYDPALSDAQVITDALGAAGYLEELAIPFETGQAVTRRDGPAFFRHTAAYQQTGRAVSFAQQTGYAGRALWPCPGIGTLDAKLLDEGE
jgi:copper chaperone CopZ